MTSATMALVRKAVSCAGCSGQAEEVFGGSDQPGGQPAERVRQRRPLRHGGQGDEGKRHADGEPATIARTIQP